MSLPKNVLKIIEKVRSVDTEAANWLFKNIELQDSYFPDATKLISLMYWEFMPQGHSYWQNLSFKIEKKEDRNTYTHYYLYAKGHYKRTSLIDDLKKITSERSMILEEYIEIKDITDILLSLAWKHINDSKKAFIDFISDIAPENKWKLNKNKETDYWETVLTKCLSILRFVDVKGLNLGDADPKILPLINK